eukprot:1010692-Rhodomonas_salina.1
MSSCAVCRGPGPPQCRRVLSALALRGHHPVCVPVDHGIDWERVPYHLKEVPDHQCGQRVFAPPVQELAQDLPP